MKMLTMENFHRALVISTCGFMITACSPEESTAKDALEKQVEDYIQKFSYQNTYDYVMQFTGGDAGKLNGWAMASRHRDRRTGPGARQGRALPLPRHQHQGGLGRAGYLPQCRRVDV